jgi:FtsH-binding integral membrane protein
MIKIKHVDSVYIQIECDKGIAKELSSFFTFRVPNSEYNPAFRKKKWDGKIRLYNIITNKIYAGLLPYVMTFASERFSKTGLQLFLYAFSALMGLSFATIFVIYSIGSIFTAFMGGAVLFGTMSLYGYFTKKDLTSVGSFMFVGLIAIVIASIINIFIGSTVLQMVISALAIVIFMGLTAYDTQNIRQIVSHDSDTGREEVLGALSLYLNFINLFLSLLQLFGDRKD